MLPKIVKKSNVDVIHSGYSAITNDVTAKRKKRKWKRLLMKFKKAGVKIKKYDFRYH